MQTSPVEREQTTLESDSFIRGTLSARPYPLLAGGALQTASRRYARPDVRIERSPWLRERPTRVWLDRACRIVNFCVALLAVAVALPVMVVIGLAVWLTSPGPILYVQERVGMDRRHSSRTIPFQGERRRASDRGGKLFRIYKFRTMYVQNRPAEVWAKKDDPRITPVGRFLRAYRLDELPQLINVLKGDMNVVGPRPEQPGIFQELRRELDGYAERQRVLPGITGWAQINHHYDQSLEDVERKLQLDLEYIQRRSAFEDLKIMVRTMPVMLFRRGAM